VVGQVVEYRQRDVERFFYTTDPSIANLMVSHGWVVEGVAMCVRE